MARERPGHTLQATALVNEAFLCLIDAEVPWQSRAHFYAVAAQAMRHILVDYAKARHAQKRGGDLVAVTLNEELVGLESEADILELHDAFERLSAFDARKSRIVELTYFAGLSCLDAIVRKAVISTADGKDPMLERRIGAYVVRR